jgi:alanine dehydrogenase
VAPLTWLDAAAVRELMPSIEEQLDLVAETYVAAARGRVELPPKPGVHPREDSFLNAMPAWLVDRDVVALKWVAAYPHNARHGLPAISGLVVVNDAATGVPEVVMDAEAITAVRTAVASGVAVRHLAPAGWRRVAILGFGAQGRSHAEVVRTLRPDAEVVAWGPRLVEPPADAVPGLEVAPDARSAVAGADVVVTAGPMPRERRPVVATDWLAEECLVLPVDYDARVRPEVSHAVDLFAVDDLPQFDAFRERGAFEGWAAPSGSLGEALQRDPPGGRRLVCSLGVGSVDAVVAGVVRDRARETGAGVLLRD